MNINDVKNIIAYNASSIPVLFEMCRIAKITKTINNKEKQALEKEAKHIGKKAFACAEDALRKSASFVKKVESLHYSVETCLEDKVSRKYAKK